MTQTEYTPSTDLIRIMVGYSKTTARDRSLPVEEARWEGYEWFDRWLADHDAEVRQGVRDAVAALLRDPSIYTTEAVNGVVAALSAIDSEVPD